MQQYYNKGNPFFLLWKKLKWRKLKMWKCFDNWCGKTFCYLDRAYSIKNNLQTCNLQIGQYKYKSVKFSSWNVVTFSHLQMDIFCHFNFCNSRRNALGFSDIPLSSRWGKSLIWFFLCMVQWPENYLKSRNASH